MAFSQDIEDSGRPKNLRNKASVPSIEKKQAGTNFIGKLFGKQPENKGREENSLGPEIGDIGRMAYLGNLKPAVFVRPNDPSHQGSQMQPRREEGFPPRGARSEDGSDSFVSPITRARNRAETDAILTGRVSEEDLEFAAEEDTFNESAEHAEHAEQENFDDNFEHAEREAFDSNFEYAEQDTFDNSFEYAKQGTFKIDESDNVNNVFGSSEECTVECVSLQRDTPRADSPDLNTKQQIEYVAVVNGQGRAGAEQWKHYLECYTNGQFSLIRPPPPPQYSRNFRFLSAVYPPNEAERLSLCAKYDIVWAHGSECEKLGLLVAQTIKRFGALSGCVSFFDEQNEVVMIECGHQRSLIDRNISIAAHVLYASDVMVVLDTKQDWRFENNPLVDFKPRIRFFAGAPLLSTGGEVVGVLAVFGKEPRIAFTPQQRSELAEFGKDVMKELNFLADTLTDPDLRTTPLLERDSIINGVYRPRNLRSPPRLYSTEDVEPNLMPSALQCQMKSPMTNSGPFINSQNNFGPHGDPTPPSSSESHNNSFFNKPQSFGKNYEQLCEDPVLNGQATSGSENLRASTPRPFSSSDLTSIHPHPPNTPDRSLMEEDLSQQTLFDLTVEGFFHLSDDDCAEQSRVEQPKQQVDYIDRVISAHQTQMPRSIPVDGTERGSHKRPVVNAKARSAELNNPFVGQSMGETGSNHPSSSTALARIPPHPMKAPPSMVSPSANEIPQEKKNKDRDMGQLCSDFANLYDFDLVYCVVLKVDLHVETGLRMRPLLSFGPTGAKVLPELASGIHLRALRSKDCMKWHNPQCKYKADEYALGYMLPLHPEDGDRKLRESGVVLGAFRLPRAHGYEERHPDQERQTVIDFAKKLSTICLPRSRLSTERWQIESPAQGFKGQPTMKRSHTDHVASSAFPANEAVEVTFGDEASCKYSTNVIHSDAFTPSPFPGSEATEASFDEERVSQDSRNAKPNPVWNPFNPVAQNPYNPVIQGPFSPVIQNPFHPVAYGRSNPVTHDPFNPVEHAPLSEEDSHGSMTEASHADVYPRKMEVMQPKTSNSRKFSKTVKRFGAEMVQQMGRGGFA